MLSISNIVKYFNNLVESLHNLNDFTDDVRQFSSYAHLKISNFQV